MNKKISYTKCTKLRNSYRVRIIKSVFKIPQNSPLTLFAEIFRNYMNFQSSHFQITQSKLTRNLTKQRFNISQSVQLWFSVNELQTQSLLLKRRASLYSVLNNKIQERSLRIVQGKNIRTKLKVPGFDSGSEHFSSG